MPKISVVTPSLNQSQFLRRTIESVLSQPVDLEYIIVDGCSSDGSLDILKEYESRVHIIVEQDNGQAEAINKGFTYATGDIWAWLNSDDMYLPGALAKVNEAYMEGNEFIYGNVYIIDKVDTILRKRTIIPVKFTDLFYGGFILPQEATFFSRSLYTASGGLNPSYHYAMDYDLWIRMAQLSRPKRLNEFLACFRFHEQQKSRQSKLYVNEMALARKSLQRTSTLFVVRSLFLSSFTKLKVLLANIRALGIRSTASDVLKKCRGKLP